jgi:hypothetical protein
VIVAGVESANANHQEIVECEKDVRFHSFVRVWCSNKWKYLISHLTLRKTEFNASPATAILPRKSTRMHALVFVVPSKQEVQSKLSKINFRSAKINRGKVFEGAEIFKIKICRT